MNVREQGYLLLSSTLGVPGRKILSPAQLRNLAQRAVTLEPQPRELCYEDLIAIGCESAMAQRILGLLEDTQVLESYLQRARSYGCTPITRVSEAYPLCLRKRMGLDSPGCLWAKGDLSLLRMSAVSLVGSRELGLLNGAFAAEVGEQAAKQGYVLVSGNAKGADRTAQESALRHGGKVISVVADALHRYPAQKDVLYLSEEGFDLGFSSRRALSRNRVIHSLGQMTLVAQCTKGQGGTWDGSLRNLQNRYSPLYVLDDGSDGAEALLSLGARPICGMQLNDFSIL